MSLVTDHQSPLTGKDEVNLLDYWRIIWKYKKSIMTIVAIASIAAVFISLSLPKTYKADAVIMPVSSKGGGGGLSAMASQFGGLASLAGINLGGSAGDTEKILAILKSRTLAENVINRENLMPILYEGRWDKKAGKWKVDDPEKQPNMEGAVRTIKSAVVSTLNKKAKTIKITGIFKGPRLAARVVTTYLVELQKFINANALTVAKRNRIFIEGQLEENKRDILEFGKEINEFYNKNKISNVEARVDVFLNGLKALKVSDHGIENRGSDIVVKLAKADPLTAGAGLVMSNSDSGIVNSQPQLSQLMIRKDDIDERIVETRIVKNVPQQVYLTYLMLRREILAKINALLTTQYELAKIEESRENLAFQVIDTAVPPERRFSPKRARICIMSFVAALFFAVLQAFFRERLRGMKALQR